VHWNWTESMYISAEDHPMYLGCCALSAKDYVHISIEKADLIINVGHDVVEKPPFLMKYGSFFKKFS
jgi:acetolactate synthase-1/2/3 large subunit